jgi:hypothetical protein
MSGDYHNTMWPERAGLVHVETLPDRFWAFDTSPCRSLTFSVQLFDWRVRNFALKTLSFYLSEWVSLEMVSRGEVVIDGVHGQPLLSTSQTL